VDEPPSLTFLLKYPAELVLMYPATYFLTAALALISAFIAASQTAFVSVSNAELERFMSQAKASEPDQHRYLIATIGLLNVLARIGLTTSIATALVDESAVGWSAVLVLCAVIFVELIPRFYVRRYSFAFVRLTSGLWWSLATICKPIVRLLGSDETIPKRQFDASVGYADEKKTTTVEKDMLTGIAAFGKLTVRQVMRNRPEISAIDASSSFTSLMEIIDKCGFSRIPVYRNTLDTIDGILYIKDLLPFLEHPADFQWRSLVRPGLLVQENKKIDSLLKDFQDKRVHMAIVVDEQGKTIGLVTLEDLIEEIIGEINDEFDDADSTAGNRKTMKAKVNEQV